MEALERNLERILGDPGHGGALGDPMRLLRDVCEGGGKEGAREREGGGAWEQVRGEVGRRGRGREKGKGSGMRRVGE